MSLNGHTYTFDGCAGSAALLAAQIRAGQVFPAQMRAWLERHPPASEPPKVRPKRVIAPVVADPLPSNGPRRRGRAVVTHVCKRTGLNPFDILGRRRSADLVAARRRISRIMRRLGFSWHDIGRTLERDHSTIIHYLNSAAD